MIRSDRFTKTACGFNINLAYKVFSRPVRNAIAMYHLLHDNFKDYNEVIKEYQHACVNGTTDGFLFVESKLTPLEYTIPIEMSRSEFYFLGGFWMRRSLDNTSMLFLDLFKAIDTKFGSSD